MKSERGFRTIIAVAFALALILCSSAQASNLLGLGGAEAPRPVAERSVGLFDQASAWLLGAWAEVKAFVSGTPVAPPTTTTASCDSGWGLDPEGCPR